MVFVTENQPVGVVFIVGVASAGSYRCDVRYFFGGVFHVFVRSCPLRIAGGCFVSLEETHG